jgi:molybdenum cofactor cytidylyltransferase
MIIAGIILAAGTSSRMGSANKLLMKYKRHTIMEEVMEQLSGSEVDEILVVTGFERARIEGLFAHRLTSRVNFTYNSNYRLGRAESIKCAIRQVKGRADAALFVVADKPEVSSALINRTIDRYLKDRPAILYVETPTGRGHPIIFSKELFTDLLLLKGDCVGDELVAKYEGDLIRLKDDKQQIDVDCEADYRTLLRNEPARGPDGTVSQSG